MSAVSGIKKIFQEKPLFPKLLWQRPVHYYKAEAGKVLIIAGSKGKTGAAILTCEAVFRSGTGILLLGFPRGLRTIYRNVLPDAMTLELPETPYETLSKKAHGLIIENAQSIDSVIIGPGISQNAETAHLIWELLFEITKPIVLDNDGLYALLIGLEVMIKKESLEFVKNYFAKKTGKLILTVTPDELTKIVKTLHLGKNYTNKYVKLHKDEVSSLVAKILSCYVITKDSDTTLADQNSNIIINRIDDNAIESSESGDVLAGIVGSFISQNPDKIWESAATAIYLQGLAGSIARAKKMGGRVLASDIIRYLPEAIKRLEE